MQIEGFREKVHAKEFDIVDDKEGKVKFIIGHSGDDVMSHPAIKEAVKALQNEERVKDVFVQELAEEDALNNMDDEFEYSDEDADTQELTKLMFNTKSKVIQVYHQELSKRIMDIPGFYQKIYDRQVDIVSESKGKMTFILKQSIETAMNEQAIKNVLDLLGNEERVSGIDFDELMPFTKEKTEIVEQFKTKSKRSKPKLTQAVLISFTVKTKNVKQYSDEMMAECRKIPYFQYKMYENKINIVNDSKAKFQFLMFHSGDNAMEDPDLVQAMFLLEARGTVSKLKVETIPYFLE